MSINLQKGQKINLTKTANNNLKDIMIGMGWKINSFGQNYDLDASVVMIEKSKNIYDTISYKKLKSSCLNIKHQGDNLVGSSGNKDDEQIMINLENISSEISKLYVIVNIYEAHSRNQHFGKVNKAYIRLVNKQNKIAEVQKKNLLSKFFSSKEKQYDESKELLRYNLTDNYDKKTGIVVCEIYRTSNGWDFKAIGDGTKDGSISEMEATILQKYL